MGLRRLDGGPERSLGVFVFRGPENEHSQASLGAFLELFWSPPRLFRKSRRAGGRAPERP